LNKPIGVPRCAISISRAFRANNAAAENATPTSKRRKHTSSNDKLTLAQTAISDDEEAADIKFLFSDDDTKGEDLVIL
jgi:ubiquitin-conjugating enzyme E2 Q